MNAGYDVRGNNGIKAKNLKKTKKRRITHNEMMYSSYTQTRQYNISEYDIFITSQHYNDEKNIGFVFFLTLDAYS